MEARTVYLVIGHKIMLGSNIFGTFYSKISLMYEILCIFFFSENTMNLNAPKSCTTLLLITVTNGIIKLMIIPPVPVTMCSSPASYCVPQVYPRITNKTC